MPFLANYKYRSKFDVLHILKGENQVVDDLISRLFESHAFIKLQFEQAQGRYKEFADALQTKYLQFQVGKMVWFPQCHIKTSRL